MPKRTYHKPQKNQQTQQVLKKYNCDHEVKKFQTIMQNFMKDNVNAFGHKANCRHQQPPMRDMLKINIQSKPVSQKRQRTQDFDPYCTSYSELGTTQYKKQVMIGDKEREQECERQLIKKICCGDYLLDDLPEKYLTKYFDDYAKQCIETYEDLIQALSRNKRGRNLLQNIIGRRAKTQDGKEMVIGERFRVSIEDYDNKANILLQTAGYMDILEAIRYTPDGQEFLKEFQHTRLTENKGILDFDKILQIMQSQCPTKADLIALMKTYAKRNDLINVILYYIGQLYKEAEQMASSVPLEKSSEKSEKKKPKMKKLKLNLNPERLKRRKARIKKFNETTRWLPNTAFQTYFGKPAFCQYGGGNKQPTSGGIMYGQYMMSHNINPHRYPNNPKNQEVFPVTEIKYDTLEAQGRIKKCEPPRKCKAEYSQSQYQVKQLMERGQISPNYRKSKPKTFEVTELMDTQRFASNQDSPLQRDTHCWVDCEKVRDEQAVNLESLTQRSTTLRLKNTVDKESKSRRFYKKNINRRMERKMKTSKKKRKRKSKRSKKQKETMKRTLKCSENQSKDWKSKYHVDYNGDNPEPLKITIPRVKIPKDFHETLRKSQEMQKMQTQDYENYEIPENAIQLVSSKQVAEKDVFDVPTDEEKITRRLFNETMRNRNQFIKTVTQRQNPRSKTEEYFSQLAKMELDPKNYSNVPSVWLNRIPYAGKVSAVHQNIKDNLDFGH